MKAKTIICLSALLALSTIAAATPGYSWDLAATYSYAPAKLDESAITQSMLDSMNYWDACYPLADTYPSGAGLTPEQMQEIADLVNIKYYITRDPGTGELSGRDLVMDTEDAVQAPPTAPASFNADWCQDVNKVIDYYASASAEQAPIIQQAYLDLIELYVHKGYWPGWTGTMPSANGYEYRWYGHKTLRMAYTLPQPERELFLLSLFFYSGAGTLWATDMPDTLYSNTDQYYCVFPTAFMAAAKMTDNAFKWQLLSLFRRQMDVGLVGTNGQNCLITEDGGIIHHSAHHIHYAVYSFYSVIQTFRNFIQAGFTTPLTAQSVERFRKAALSWAWTDTNGTFPIHCNARPTMLSKNYSNGFSYGNSVWYLQMAAELTALYEHGNAAMIADDLELAYPAIVKTGEGSGALPAAWRTIDLPELSSDPEQNWYLLDGHHSFQVMGAALHRRDNWIASVRMGHKFRTQGETYNYCGTVVHHLKQMPQGSFLLITEGKNGRAPNEADSGMYYEGYDHNYWPNVTDSIKTQKQLIFDEYYGSFPKKGVPVAGANLFDNGVWMTQHEDIGYRKSAFFFDNRITLVTTAITGSNSAGYVTGLIQQGHPDFTNYPIKIDGVTYSGTGIVQIPAGGNHKIIDINGNGYYIHPNASTPSLTAVRSIQSWTYGLAEYWIGPGTMPGYMKEPNFLDDVAAGYFTPTTGNYSKVYFNHGQSPNNSSAIYTVLVKPAAGEFDNFVTAMNTPGQQPLLLYISPTDGHLFWDRASNTWAMSLFSNSLTVNTAGLVSATRSGSYMWQNTGSAIHVSCGSSDMANTAPFVMVFSGCWQIDTEYDTLGASCVFSPATGNTTVTLPYYQFARQGFVLAADLPPVFGTNPVIKPNAYENRSYSQTLAADASDPEELPLTFAKLSGPAWLTVASDGTLSGTPADANTGLNTFSVRATDNSGQSANAQLQINVINLFTGQNGMPDFNVIASNWLLASCGDCSGADLDGDNDVDTADLEQFAQQWLTTN